MLQYRGTLRHLALLLKKFDTLQCMQLSRKYFKLQYKHGIFQMMSAVIVEH